MINYRVPTRRMSQWENEKAKWQLLLCFFEWKNTSNKLVLSSGAGGRGRTDTSCYGPRILSPVRLPFRHTGIIVTTIAYILLLSSSQISFLLGCSFSLQNIRFVGALLRKDLKGWRHHPDSNWGWGFCRPEPYHLAMVPQSQTAYLLVCSIIHKHKLNICLFILSHFEQVLVGAL